MLLTMALSLLLAANSETRTYPDGSWTECSPGYYRYQGMDGSKIERHGEGVGCPAARHKRPR